MTQCKRVTARGGSCSVCGLEKAAWIDRPADQVSFGPLTFTAVTTSYPATPSLLAVLSTIHHFFDIDESQARGPSARVRLSKIAGLM
jgi:hypothetical protein